MVRTFGTGDVNNLLYTFNTVSTGIHYIYSNVSAPSLLQNMAWSSTAPSSNWNSFDPKNVNAWFNISAGQSYNFTATATDKNCTSSRTLTFVAMSSYRIYSSTNITSTLAIGFDNTTNLEALPVSIAIYDEKTGKEEGSVKIKEIFDKKGFIDDTKLEIDVRKYSRGMKIVRFMYEIGRGASNKIQNDTQVEVRTERVILVN